MSDGDDLRVGCRNPQRLPLVVHSGNDAVFKDDNRPDRHLARVKGGWRLFKHAPIQCSCHCKGFSYVSNDFLRCPGNTSPGHDSPRIPAAQFLDVVVICEEPHASTGGPPPENRRVTVMMIGDERARATSSVDSRSRELPTASQRASQKTTGKTSARL